MVFRLEAAPYGTQRSMMISRGRAGAAGIRSMMTDRGGTAKAASLRTTVCAATEAGG